MHGVLGLSPPIGTEKEYRCNELISQPRVQASMHGSAADESDQPPNSIITALKRKPLPNLLLYI